MENQDLDLIGKTVGNMPYKIGIVDQNGNLKNQFVAKASTNRIDIPQSALGTGGGSTGGNTGGTTGGTAPSQVSQLPSTVNLFSGSAVGNILLSGPSTNYENVQDGLLITLSNLTLEIADLNIGGNYGLPTQVGDLRIDLSPSGLKTIKIPKEKLVVNSSIDISDQLSQYIGKMIQLQYKDTFNNWSNIDSKYSFDIVSFGGTTINVLPNTTLSMNLTVSVNDIVKDKFPIPVIRVNTYKN
ncbi:MULTISPECIES: hypothetical protein [Companilactobacillus]|uniref:hypothetical protein n=1 Tax=Companilactobacillus TaxID=2767879 RepID=UPI002FEE997C